MTDRPPPPEEQSTFKIPTADAPVRIGSYRLKRLIGQGGMGEVHLAEQMEPIKRLVALKLIKSGMDSKTVIGRFEAERQALALMNHPNIAKVLDAGATDEGRPYFVMEYIQGVPITEYCDRHRLPTEDRLRLFVQVCHGVQHAHQKGLIHRDLKPSNILVAVEDGVAAPKIIDFGVAKATHQSLTQATVATQLGQMLGTLEYMSPEQADLTNEDIDTRSDIYSLGVVLYELLTSTLPIDSASLRGAAFDEVRRKIREETPALPSTRITVTSDGSDDPARRRGADMRSWRRQVSGDPDWISMKCLEKERARRYPSASELAADIERHLQNEPTVARPPSVRYRLLKFLRRNKEAVFSLACLLAAVVGLGGVVMYQQHELSAAEMREHGAYSRGLKNGFNFWVDVLSPLEGRLSLPLWLGPDGVIDRRRSESERQSLLHAAEHVVRVSAVESIAQAHYLRAIAQQHAVIPSFRRLTHQTAGLEESLRIFREVDESFPFALEPTDDQLRWYRIYSRLLPLLGPEDRRRIEMLFELTHYVRFERKDWIASNRIDGTITERWDLEVVVELLIIEGLFPRCSSVRYRSGVRSFFWKMIDDQIPIPDLLESRDSDLECLPGDDELESMITRIRELPAEPAPRSRP